MAATSDSAALAQAAFRALSDSERLLIASLRTIARGLADATYGMSDQAAERHISEAIFELMQSLGGASDAFTSETARYLRDAVRRARAH